VQALVGERGLSVRIRLTAERRSLVELWVVTGATSEEMSSGMQAV
jgi:hypothetical protein